nr:MAG TPA: hypothetical protein [Caudoviricetes sp.]
MRLPICWLRIALTKKGVSAAPSRLIGMAAF